MKQEIRILTNQDKDLVIEYLSRNHIETTFLIGNVLEFGLENDGVKRRCGDYYGYFEDSALKGILNFYNLGSSIPHFESIAAVPYFVEMMKDRKFEVLLGMANIVSPIYEELSKYKTAKEYSDDAYYLNKDFKPFLLNDVEIKDAKEVEFEAAIDFMIEVRNVGFGESAEKEQMRKLLLESVPEEDRVFVLKNGEIVAHAVIQATTSEINQVGGVYTSTKHRGNGYCKAAVSRLCQNIVDRGKTPTLMVRKNNTPAVKAYEAIGFKYFRDYLIINY